MERKKEIQIAKGILAASLAVVCGFTKEGLLKEYTSHRRKDKDIIPAAVAASYLNEVISEAHTIDEAREEFHEVYQTFLGRMQDPIAASFAAKSILTYSGKHKSTISRRIDLDRDVDSLVKDTLNEYGGLGGRLF